MIKPDDLKVGAEYLVLDMPLIYRVKVEKVMRDVSCIVFRRNGQPRTATNGNLFELSDFEKLKEMAWEEHYSDKGVLESSIEEIERTFVEGK